MNSDPWAWGEDPELAAYILAWMELTAKEEGILMFGGQWAPEPFLCPHCDQKFYTAGAYADHAVACRKAKKKAEEGGQTLHQDQFDAGVTECDRKHFLDKIGAKWDESPNGRQKS